MIKKIGVCGAGTMGSGIAQVAAMGGFQTLLFDVDPGMVQKGQAAIEKSLQALVEKQKLSAEEQAAILRRISAIHRIEDCVADLIIEAIVEQPEAKSQLFHRLAAQNSGETILASNTSSLSLDALAATISGPERFIGMHFFNPAPLMRLVEIINTKRTTAATTQTALAVARQMGKTPVICKDSPGFIVNHVARPYYLEAMRLVEAGIGDFETIDSLMEATGFRMGPFRLMDLIGNDINYAVSCSVFEAMGKPLRLRPSPLQEEKVQNGELGRKTRKGYYRYA
ncbi:MAG TPA: 3-hydroxyacyl-CoA dehydrogenase NAD-binding domain-containing protein [Puia sp.]|uniref:3-hydroxyacyl-CoA dehydrogenase NAD-binding domain-containing protein n=1 Tax=Puia sp. TaxID=2045100 RepID=UPI002C00722A|nr:3-hydroxyacyl-CoA dehydrogenase NAD-binding domain-containing protein [Puia sp.]HVU98840.1 3-hydroxyacyl-CoA dehydrogenase NAD-binding domain-containing protein [Puia sp.]